MKHRVPTFTVVCAALLCHPLGVKAESSEEVEGAGMAQGSGAITTRSEVSVAVESLLGTPALRHPAGSGAPSLFATLHNA